ncbi:MAG: ABC transporter permease [Thermomicrobiales bacterium]
MLRFITCRVLAMIPSLLIVSIVVFSLLHLVPGDPAQQYFGVNAKPEALEAMRKELGLDRPVHEQYLTWLWGLLHGDLGMSLIHRTPITEMFASRLPVTIELVALSMVVAIVLGVGAGVISGTRQYSRVDFTISMLGLTGISLPNFWLGTMLALVFSVKLGWLPFGGYVPFSEDPIGNIKSMIMPSLSLGLVSASIIMRMTRSALMDVSRRDYIRTARAKGAPEGMVVRRHMLKNALIPVTTVAGMEAGYMFGGAFLVEAVFYLPGVPTYALAAVLQRDYPVLQAATLLIAVAFMTINLGVDVLNAYIDPRQRESIARMATA